MIRVEFMIRGFVDAVSEEDAIDLLDVGLRNVGAKPESMSVGDLDVHYLKEVVKG